MSTPVAAPAAAAPAVSAPSSTPAPSTPAPSSPSIGSSNTPPQGTSEAKADAGVAKEVAAQKAEEIRKWKLKGKSGEVELTESELVRRAQLGLGADEAFQEASKMRKSAESLFEALKADPIAVLKHLGLNVRDLTEGYLSKELQNEMLSPEQRELSDLREFKRRQEETTQETEKTTAATAKQADFQQSMQRAAKEYDTKISEVLASSNLPKTPYTVKRVAELMKNALQKGYDLDVTTAVDMVREGYMSDFKALFGGLKGAHLAKFLGDDVTKEMRQFDLARIKAKLQVAQGGQDGTTAPEKITAPSTPRTRPDGVKQMRQDEWLEHIRKKAGV